MPPPSASTPLNGEVPLERDLASLTIIIDADAFRNKPAIDLDAIEKAAMALGRLAVRSVYYTSPARDDITETKRILDQQYYVGVELPNRELLRMTVVASLTKQILSECTRDVLLVTDDDVLGALPGLIRSAAPETHVSCIVVRAREQTQQSFIRSFDQFRFYSEICNTLPDAALASRKRYLESLLLAALRLEKQGSKPVGAALIPLLRYEYPEASPSALQIGNWRDFAELGEKQGWWSIIGAGSDFQLVLTKQGRTGAERLLAQSLERDSHASQVGRIGSAVAEILGIPLPDARVRNNVFSAADWLLSGEFRDGLHLVQLSYEVVAHLGWDNSTQNTTFRLLNGLVRGGGFEYRPHPTNRNDPILLRPKLKADIFDDAFVVATLFQQRKYPALAEGAAKDLARVFYGKEELADRIERLRSIAADPNFDRGNLPAMLRSES